MTMYITRNRRLANMREAMDRMMEEAYSEPARTEREMLLAVDVRAEEELFTIQAYVPGLSADDLSIEILNNTVSIRGEFKCAAEEGSTLLTCELPQGRFNRNITLPVAVDAAKAEASIQNGLLTLRVPKAEAHRPKTIKIVSQQ